ncbi:MAG: type II secretion system protein M [Myxococcota bacterium]|nr:type II secretion system protein M [Myxococcota bacterium]
MNERLEGLRAQWEALTDREKRLVRGLGVVAAALLVMLPVYLLSSAIGDLERQNEEIAGVLSEIDRADERLAQREAERSAAEARYNQRAPELGTFLEGRASAREMTIASVTNQPEVQAGRFRKRHVRASFPGTSLRQAVRLMTDLENAPYPIALERVHMEHHQSGDHYNLEIGVITYDRTASPDRDAGAASAPAPGASGRAGPPPPP